MLQSCEKLTEEVGMDSEALGEMAATESGFHAEVGFRDSLRTV